MGNVNHEDFTGCSCNNSKWNDVCLWFSVSFGPFILHYENNTKIISIGGRFTLVLRICVAGKHLGIGNSKVTLSCLIWVNSHFHLWNHHGFLDVGQGCPSPQIDQNQKRSHAILRGRAFVDASIRWARFGLKKSGKTKLVKPEVKRSALVTRSWTSSNGAKKTSVERQRQTSRMILGVPHPHFENYSKVRKDTEMARSENAEVTGSLQQIRLLKKIRCVCWC